MMGAERMLKLQTSKQVKVWARLYINDWLTGLERKINDFLKSMLAYTHHGILLALKKERLIHVTSWINLYGVILTEESQYSRVTWCMIPFMWHSSNGTIIQTEPLLPEIEIKGQGEGSLKEMNLTKTGKYEGFL